MTRKAITRDMESRKNARKPKKITITQDIYSYHFIHVISHDPNHFCKEIANWKGGIQPSRQEFQWGNLMVGKYHELRSLLGLE